MMVSYVVTILHMHVPTYLSSHQMPYQVSYLNSKPLTPKMGMRFTKRILTLNRHFLCKIVPIQKLELVALANAPKNPGFMLEF
jgi:hypothetical protein